MKIAFIEPAIASVEPLGIAYLAQAVAAAGHQARYFEAPRADFVARLRAFGPDVLGYSVTTGKHRLCQELNAALRRQMKAVSLFGGPHATFCPEFMERDEFIDGACRGEGESALPELLTRLETGRAYTQTANWWLRAKGKIYKNAVREQNHDLDALGFPDREMIYAENPGLRAMPIKRVLGARGCPYACSYCFNKQYNRIYRGAGKIQRGRSAQNLVAELKMLKAKYAVTFIKFVEDIFGLDLDMREFAEGYAQEIRIPFICNLRPNLLTEEKVAWLKQAGCAAVTVAVESGNETIRNRILNRNISPAELDQGLARLKAAGIRVHTQNIIANPGETFGQALETFGLNVRHRVDFAEGFILTPYPGTDIHDYCRQHHYFDGDTGTLPKSYWLESCLRFGSKREKRRLVNFQKFFSFGVQHPVFLPLIKILVELPPNPGFVLFNRVYDAWRFSRVLRAKFNFKNWVRTAWNNLWFIQSYFINRGAGGKI